MKEENSSNNSTKKNPQVKASNNTTKKNPQVKASKNDNTSSFDFAFGPVNYILLAIGILLLGLGYILLSGGGSDNPNVFNPAMFDSRRLVVAPLLIVAGLVIEICAIMVRQKKNVN